MRSFFLWNCLFSVILTALTSDLHGRTRWKKTSLHHPETIWRLLLTSVTAGAFPPSEMLLYRPVTPCRARLSYCILSRPSNSIHFVDVKSQSAIVRIRSHSDGLSPGSCHPAISLHSLIIRGTMTLFPLPGSPRRSTIRNLFLLVDYQVVYPHHQRLCFPFVSRLISVLLLFLFTVMLRYSSHPAIRYPSCL